MIAIAFPLSRKCKREGICWAYVAWSGLSKTRILSEYLDFWCIKRQLGQIWLRSFQNSDFPPNFKLFNGCACAQSSTRAPRWMPCVETWLHSSSISSSTCNETECSSSVEETSEDDEIARKRARYACTFRPESSVLLYDSMYKVSRAAEPGGLGGL